MSCALLLQHSELVDDADLPVEVDVQAQLADRHHEDGLRQMAEVGQHAMMQLQDVRPVLQEHRV